MRFTELSSADTIRQYNDFAWVFMGAVAHEAEIHCTVRVGQEQRGFRKSMQQHVHSLLLEVPSEQQILKASAGIHQRRYPGPALRHKQDRVRK
jgi:hypothetical protein